MRPYIRQILGLPADRLRLDIELAMPSSNDSKRDFFKRGRIIENDGRLQIQPLESQESHMLSSLAGADILFLHPAGSDYLPAGEKVRCWLLKG